MIAASGAMPRTVRQTGRSWAFNVERLDVVVTVIVDEIGVRGVQRVGRPTLGFVIRADGHSHDVVPRAHVLGMATHVVQIPAHRCLQRPDHLAAEAMRDPSDVQAAGIVLAVENLRGIGRETGVLQGCQGLINVLAGANNPNDELAGVRESILDAHTTMLPPPDTSGTTL